SVCIDGDVVHRFLTAQIPNSLARTWGRVRWKLAAIIFFLGSCIILVASLGIAALNVMVRRESANVVEKQIQVLVEGSRPVASTILDAGSCAASPANPA